MIHSDGPWMAELSKLFYQTEQKPKPLLTPTNQRKTKFSSTERSSRDRTCRWFFVTPKAMSQSFPRMQEPHSMNKVKRTNLVSAILTTSRNLQDRKAYLPLKFTRLTSTGNLRSRTSKRRTSQTKLSFCLRETLPWLKKSK